MIKKDYEALAQLLYPDVTITPQELEKRYPPRDLPSEAKVTRMAPSPTGFVHMGAMYGVMMDERLAHQSGGIFYLRIEDTDAKREVENGVGIICDTFAKLGVPFDEGATEDGDNGAFGPYRQRQRVDIYHCIAKELVRIGRAYPCFCTEEELGEMRAKQEIQKANFGYYGSWAVHRNISLEETKTRLEQGCSFVLRFRSEGDPERRIHHEDLIKGSLELPENNMDHVLLKSDGVPTYHFAHVVDDHLMRTTHVIRGEEWLPSLPFHVELFQAIGWELPHYGHTAQVLKLDGSSKRKLSKRKDPEADMRYYLERGYYIPAIMDYLLTLLNSNFEEWRLKNPLEDYAVFPFSLDKAGVSGALFDLNKLNDISKNRVSLLDGETVYRFVSQWAAEYDPEFHRIIAENPDYTVAILSIGRGGSKPRKDFGMWSEVKDYISFFFDQLFTPANVYPENMPAEDVKKILEEYGNLYHQEDDQSAWFDRIRELSAKLGYAPETKLYKKNPDLYKGHVGDVSMVLRVAVTGRTNSPDMYQVMSILGRQRILQRLQSALSRLKNNESVH